METFAVALVGEEDRDWLGEACVGAGAGPVRSPFSR